MESIKYVTTTNAHAFLLTPSCVLSALFYCRLPVAVNNQTTHIISTLALQCVYMLPSLCSIYTFALCFSVSSTWCKLQLPLLLCARDKVKLKHQTTCRSYDMTLLREGTLYCLDRHSMFAMHQLMNGEKEESLTL